MASILPTPPKEETPSILPKVTATQQEQFPDRYLREVAERYAFRNNIPVDQAIEKARAAGPYSLVTPPTAIQQYQQSFIEQGLSDRKSLEDIEASVIRLNRSRNMLSVAGTATDKVENFAFDNIDPTQKYLFGLSLLQEEVAARSGEQTWTGATIGFVDAVFRDAVPGLLERAGETVPLLQGPLSLIGLDKSTSDRTREALQALDREQDPEKMKVLAREIVDGWAKLGLLNNNQFLMSDQLRSATEGGLFDHAAQWSAIDLGTFGIGKLLATGTKGGKQAVNLAKARDPVDTVGILQGQKAAQNMLKQSLDTPGTVVEVERHTSPSILRVADPGVPTAGIPPVIQNELSKKIINELSNEFRDMYVTPEQIQSATDRLVGDIQKRTNFHVVDVEKVEGLLDNYTVRLKLGKADGLGWEDFFSAEKFKNIHGGTVVRDEATDTFFVVQDTGLSFRGIADPTKYEDLGYKSAIKSIIDLNNRILSPEHTSTRFLNTLLKRGESRLGTAYRKIWVDHELKFKKITGDEQKNMNVIIGNLRDGADSTRRTWYNDYEFSEHYYRLTGTTPRKEVVEAYKSIWAINDAAYYIDADKFLKNATAQGQFMGSFGKYKNLRMKSYDTKQIPSEVDEIFDVDRGSFIKVSEFKNLGSRNLILVPDGIQVGGKKAFYVTGDLVESRPLRHDEVLGYQPGGLRGTSARYYSVQEVVETQIGGRSFYKRPVTWFASMSEKDALAASKDFNKIIKAIRQTVGPNVTKDMLTNFTSDDAVNAAIRANNGFNPSIENVEDFIKFLDDSGLEVSDVSLRKADDAVPKTDIGKSIDYFQYGGPQTYQDIYRLNTNPSSASRNRVTLGYGGRHFETVDATDSITAYYSKGLNYMATRAYVKNAMEGLIKNGESVITNWDRIKTKPLIEQIQTATFKNDSIGQAFKRERQTILDRLNSKGVLAQKWEHLMQKVQEDLFDKGNDKAVNALSIFDTNPAVALRSFAYNTAFGLWNVAQYSVQFLGSALTATVVPPKYGLRAFLSYTPMRLAMIRGFDKPFIKETFRRGSKVFGMSANDWDDMMYYMKESGKFEVNLTTAYLDTAAGMSTSPMFRFMNIPGIRQIYENWDMPFKEGEGAARLISVNVAFREFREKFPSVDIKTRQGFRAMDEYITERADALTFNMTRASQAAWQKGALGLATQWQAINARFLENFFFSRSLSRTEQWKLLGSQVAMYGATGVGLESIVDSVFEEYGIDPSPEMYTAVKHGSIDALVHKMTGVPTNISDRLAFVKSMKETYKNLSEGNIFQALLGPSLSIGTGYNDAFWNLVDSSFSGNVDLIAVDFEKFVRQISSINSSTQAYYLWHYGKYVARSGRTIEGIQNPKAAAVLTMLGFRLQQVSYPFEIQQMVTDNTAAVDDLVTLARGWNQTRYQLMSEGKFDQAAEISKRIYTLRQPLPPSMQDYFDKKLEPFLVEYNSVLIDKMFDLQSPFRAERLQELSQPQGVE